VSDQFRIRIIDPWAPEDGRRVHAGGFDLWTEWSPDEAQALLSMWEPDQELLEFDGPKAWFCCEPRSTCDLYDTGKWRRVTDRLEPHEILHHRHPGPECRVPHITHWGELSMDESADRQNRAIAVVSKHGGTPRKRWQEMQLRVDFATHELVDLYGREDSWRKFRRRTFSWPGPPENYCGEIPGSWGREAKLEKMAGYRVAVCLENTCEPHYFTEKFVDAVRAGCIPVYHAHETVRDGILRDASWVDPADYDMDVEATLRAALDGDPEVYRERNAEWLQSDEVKATSDVAVYERIGEILRAKERRTAEEIDQVDER
jgi:hypothetical protein